MNSVIFEPLRFLNNLHYNHHYQYLPYAARQQYNNGLGQPAWYGGVGPFGQGSTNDIGKNIGQ